MILVGAQAFQAKLRNAAVAGPTAVLATLYQEAEVVMTAAKTDFVPVETGALRASGFVEPPVANAFGGSVTLGFGGPSAPYAVIVHEDLTKRHPVGQAKYLELPLRARIQGMQAVLRQRTGDAIRQSFQRLGKIEVNVAAGNAPLSGLPLFR